jgi:hypothetical protein
MTDRDPTVTVTQDPCTMGLTVKIHQVIDDRRFEVVRNVDWEKWNFLSNYRWQVIDTMSNELNSVIHQVRPEDSVGPDLTP